MGSANAIHVIMATRVVQNPQTTPFCDTHTHTLAYRNDGGIGTGSSNDLSAIAHNLRQLRGGQGCAA